MTKKKQIYKCDICGNVIEVLNIGAESLVCCGTAMRLEGEKSQDQGNEKHVPIIEKTEFGYKVKVGSTEHPMEESHFIEWIEINTDDGKSGKKFLNPGDKPEADFYAKANIVTVRAYCNLHGLWKSK
ncbi:MAG TPA: desulfoferrodoxin [bacterium]|jgi:superoxide reductase|nr:desulfoferrodoxin [bacterium]HOG37974.1 desulfoferrodoxin [bacterium]HQI03033.1 desulfoferrodoxin [bacterium]